MGDTGFIDRARAHNDTWLAWTRDEILALGLGVPPSAGNFVLVKFPVTPGRNTAIAEAADDFLKRRGIIVRRMAAYGLDDCLRITIGREDEMRAAASAYQQAVASGGSEEEAAKIRDAALAELTTRYEDTLMNPKEALALGSVSKVVMPGDTRKVLAKNLDFLMRTYTPSAMSGVQREFE